MFKRVRFLFVKELIQVLRDKRLRITLIFPPIFQLIVFGYAANLDVKNIATAISIEPNDFNYAPFSQRGGLGKAHQLFGPDLPKLLDELNEALAA